MYNTVENMRFAHYAVEAARAIRDAYNGNVSAALYNFVVPYETFLKTYDRIMPVFLKKVKKELRLNEDDSQLFEITFKIVLSSMLQNEQKFHTFLLGEH